MSLPMPPNPKPTSMKNTLELQLRALRIPRVLKKSKSGAPEFVDVWAIHHFDGSSRTFSIAVKCGKDLAAQALEIRIGTLFTVKGRLDKDQDKGTGKYHTFVWADTLDDLVHSKKEKAHAKEQADLLQPESPDA